MSTAAPAAPHYLTTRQAAERLGVTPGRVRQLVSGGRLPVTRIGDRNLVLASDLSRVANRVRTGRPKSDKQRTYTRQKKSKIPIDKS